MPVPWATALERISSTPEQFQGHARAHVDDGVGGAHLVEVDLARSGAGAAGLLPRPDGRKWQAPVAGPDRAGGPQ